MKVVMQLGLLLSVILVVVTALAFANTDIPGQLKELSVVAPAFLPTTLAPLLKERLGDRKLNSLSPALQRALLWEAGQVAASGVNSYVDVYVLCGQTMNNVFLSVDAVSASCPVSHCKEFSMNFAMSTCAPATLEERTLCAVIADDQSGGVGSSTTMAAYRGQLWSQEGSIDDAFAPQMYQNPFTSTNESGALYVISQRGDFKGNKDKCESTSSFVIPCRKVARAEVTETGEERKWCRPQSQLGVQLWYASESSKSSSSGGSTDTSKGITPSANSGTTTTTTDKSDDSGSSSTVTIVLGIALGVAVVLCGILFAMVMKKKSQSKNDNLPPTPGYVNASNQHGTSNGDAGSMAATSRESNANNNNGSAALRVSTYNSVSIEVVNEKIKQQSAVLAAFCDDQELMMKRIAYTGLHFGKLMASGANGEVWKGEYQGKVVAIKKALADKKDDIKTLEIFSQEIRLASGLEHPNIMRFVGLSWRTLPDLCIISEYMAVGDLAHFLPTEEGKAMTWGHEKIALASDIANALVYLHSLMPAIIHRDLKSLNILLTDDLQAKLSDFGLSREQSFENTMTSGVGTVLWTAPEILRGERYSEKADMYSFGVVLSELDTSLSPYALNPEVAGVKSKSMHLLPLISKGQISPKFLPSCPSPILELAQACLNQDPAKRPPAMQVVYMLRSKIRPLL